MEGGGEVPTCKDIKAGESVRVVHREDAFQARDSVVRMNGAVLLFTETSRGIHSARKVLSFRCRCIEEWQRACSKS